MILRLDEQSKNKNIKARLVRLNLGITLLSYLIWKSDEVDNREEAEIDTVCC